MNNQAITLSSGQLLHWMQWSSPSLPIGGFSWSRGLEAAVQLDWVTSEASFEEWLIPQIYHAMAESDLPYLIRLYQAWGNDNLEKVQYWNDLVIASRETHQLRQEERLSAKALKRLMEKTGLLGEITLPEQPSTLCLFALRASLLSLPVEALLTSTLWTWMDAQIAAGIKLIPLGQTSGQQIFQRMVPHMEAAITKSIGIEDANIGNSMPGHVMAAALHETCYSRLFRS